MLEVRKGINEGKRSIKKSLEEEKVKRNSKRVDSNLFIFR